MKRKTILFITAGALVLLGLWYFGWYMSPREIKARCYRHWVVNESDYNRAEGNFFKCFMYHGLTPKVEDWEWLRLTF